MPGSGVEVATKLCRGCGETKPLADFGRRADRKCGRTSHCKACLNAKSRARYAADPLAYKLRTAPYREARREEYRRYTAEYHAKRKALIDSLHTPCVVCGEQRIPVLDFHHVDPSTKLYAIAKLQSCAEDTLRAEIAKCISLCANCHRLLHAGDDNVGAVVESVTSPREAVA